MAKIHIVLSPVFIATEQIAATPTPLENPTLFSSAPNKSRVFSKSHMMI